MSGGTQDAASSPISFRLQGSHLLWPRFPAGSPNRRIGNSTHAVLQPPCASTWVWAVPISLAATFGISLIYFPPGTEMVHFPGLAHTRLCIQRAVARVHLAGFPHSEILGSKLACSSPRLIAACHVLLRLLAPRHSPYALSSLIIKLIQSVFSSKPNRFGLEKYDVPFPAAPYILASATPLSRAWDHGTSGDSVFRITKKSDAGFRLYSPRIPQWLASRRELRSGFSRLATRHSSLATVV